MDSGFYAACAGLVAKTRALDSVAHNLANVSTTAFKRQRVDFQALLSPSNLSGLSQVNQAINEFGVTGDPSIDLSQGSIERTGNPLDVAIEGPGFLSVKTDNGVAYTRNGHLQMSSTGQLETADGSPIIGDQGPITLPPGTVSISSSGVISVNGAIAANLKLVEFDKQAQLQETAPGLFVSASTPEPVASSTVRQGALESANVNPVESTVDLIAIQREAEMLQRALSLFHGEMNRVATSELARV
ncbi:MAG TPA: flagellar basal-body rod protein FlgF [Terriglobales bacterium]|nr:flagellar basal-body rod protein FlgF [Terriglobales bacterium]